MNVWIARINTRSRPLVPLRSLPRNCGWATGRNSRLMRHRSPAHRRGRTGKCVRFRVWMRIIDPLRLRPRDEPTFAFDDRRPAADIRQCENAATVNRRIAKRYDVTWYSLRGITVLLFVVVKRAPRGPTAATCVGRRACRVCGWVLRAAKEFFEANLT